MEICSNSATCGLTSHFGDRRRTSWKRCRNRRTVIISGSVSHTATYKKGILFHEFESFCENSDAKFKNKKSESLCDVRNENIIQSTGNLDYENCENFATQPSNPAFRHFNPAGVKLHFKRRVFCLQSTHPYQQIEPFQWKISCQSAQKNYMFPLTQRRFFLHIFKPERAQK